MKKIIITVVILFLGLVSFAQKQKFNYLTTFDDKFLHFGFTFGYNSFDLHTVSYNTLGDNPNLDRTQLPHEFSGYDIEEVNARSHIYSDIKSLTPGLTVNIITSIRLSKYFNLRFLPGMSFGERKIYFNVPIEDNHSVNENFYSIKSTYLDFPLLIKYKAKRINNDRPYVIFGAAFKYDLSNSAKEDLIKLKKDSYYLEIGAGWDRFFDYFKFSTEAKMSIGLNDQLGSIPNEAGQKKFYAQSIKEIRSMVFTLSFHFE